MDLCTAIKQWDGKSTEDISVVYHQFESSDSFVEQLITLLSDKQCEVGASWLLKARCEKHGMLSNEESNCLITVLPDLQHWQSELHLLQVFEFLSIWAQNELTVLTFVRRCLQSENKFVRAWAYHGYFCLAVTFPSYQSEVMDCLTLAMNDEPPSVKARARNLLKRGFS